MPVLSYEIITANTPTHLAQLVNAALPDKQPYGDPVLDRESGVYSQAMVTTGGKVVTDGMTLAVEPTGTYTDTVTFTVAAGEITAIALS